MVVLKIHLVARAQKISFCPTPQKNFLRPSNFVFVLVFAPPPFWAAGQLFFSGIFDKVGSSAVVKICKHKEAGASLFVFERAMGIEPTYPGWKPSALPLCYARLSSHYINSTFLSMLQ